MSSILELFEVKIRKPGDRITSTGKKVEGGKIVSRHFFRRNSKQAEDCGRALGIGIVIGVKRVRKEEIIGDLTQNKELRAFIKKPMSARELEQDRRAQNDVIVQDVSLSSIVYGNSPVQKERRSKRLEYNRKHSKELVEE